MTAHLYSNKFFRIRDNYIKLLFIYRNYLLKYKEKLFNSLFIQVTSVPYMNVNESEFFFFHQFKVIF